jgi:methionyl aminopeptidase
MPITIKSADEIAIMREAGRIVARTLQRLREICRPGTPVHDLDQMVRREFAAYGAIPTFLGYLGYPATICVSLNDEIVHGIPRDQVLKDGDIVSLDLGATYRGFVGDSAITFGVGTITPEARRLIEVTEGALQRGIEAARPGNRIGAIGHAVQRYAEDFGYGVVREYVGHGVGRRMHEDPQVPNYGPPDRGPVIQPGMVLAIEPMVNMGDWRTKRDPDGWTVRTMDGSLSAHFEHTLAITEDGPVVLTLP